MRYAGVTEKDCSHLCPPRPGALTRKGALMTRKKKQSNVDRLWLEGMFTLSQASELAKDLEKTDKTKIFAVGTIFVATNGRYVYNISNLRDKDLMLEFLKNGKPIHHPEILAMAEGVIQRLKKDYDIDARLVKVGES